MKREWSSRTTRAGAATLAAALVAGLTVTGLASAAPAAAAPAAATGPAAKVISRHTVTLLTGDVVELDTTADGKQVATVHPPAGRTQMSYQTRQSDGHAYVIPADAMPLLAADKLDEELFDVTQLVADGYDDSHVTSTPLIVQYPKSQLKPLAATALPGTTTGATLHSINAVAVKESKARAASFWSSLTGGATATTDAIKPASLAAAGTIGKVWLDGVAHVTLKDSVPQIGAPQAWAAGYDGTGVKVAILDTGIDDTHPDLAGKVVAAENFSTDTDTQDHFGHGTHVASIVAGTGAASGGVYKGVAPGATLINAKVLNSAGNGEDSGIIQGMEWAAAQGATVANMSLGTNAPSDGTDPLTQAVNEISESSGLLFAIAAGNLGSADSTISSPGWADDAITVGAVDKTDVLAAFSSRGPRLGDYGIKPDITAPGVDIIAARASGSTLGTVVDNDYMELSGTSMATPHVAGSAAILKQEHPDYTPAQIKDLLISTADPGDYSVYQQGGGRVDVGRAYQQQVYASPGTLDLGYFPYPQAGTAPVTKTVTYHNGGTADVTLNLSLDVTGKSGDRAPDGFVTLDSPSVTVPAGGDASVALTVHPDGAPVDLYGGYLTATGGGTTVHTSLGAYVEQQMYTITVPAVAHDGRQADGISDVELWGTGIDGFQTKYYSGGATPTFRVPAGTYSVMGYIFTMDEPNLYALGLSVVGRPDLTVDKDLTVTLDATKAKKIDVKASKPTAPSVIQLGYHRALNGRTFDSSFMVGLPTDEAFAAASDSVTDGDFEFWSKWTLIAPPIQIKVVAPQQITLDPLFMVNSPAVDGDHKVPLVYAGYGQPSDYDGLDVKGKMVLVSRGAGVTFVDKVRNAADAGAAAVIVFNNVPGTLYASAGDPGQVPIPAFTIDQAPGLALADLLAGGPATVDYSGTSVSGYEYDVFLPETGRIADTQTTTLNTRNTAEIDAVYTGTGDPLTGEDTKYAIRPWTTFLFGAASVLQRPLHRTEYVNTLSGSDLWWWHQAWANYPFDGAYTGLELEYKAGSKTPERWFDQVQRPGFPAGLTGYEDEGVPAFREGDSFTLGMFPYVDSDQHYGDVFGTDTATMALYQGKKQLASGDYASGTFPATPGKAVPYTLVTDEKRSAPWWQYSTDVSTTWTFMSGTPASGRSLLPLLQIGYDLQLDDLNRAPDLLPFGINLTVGDQPGVTNAAPITSVLVWASFDDGEHWVPVPVLPHGPGKVRVTVPHPAAKSTSAAVSLRVKATDRAGNSIDQTIIRAYGLKPFPWH